MGLDLHPGFVATAILSVIALGAMTVWNFRNGRPIRSVPILLAGLALVFSLGFMWLNAAARDDIRHRISDLSAVGQVITAELVTAGHGKLVQNNGSGSERAAAEQVIHLWTRFYPDFENLETVRLGPNGNFIEVVGTGLSVPPETLEKAWKGQVTADLISFRDGSVLVCVPMLDEKSQTEALALMRFSNREWPKRVNRARTSIVAIIAALAFAVLGAGFVASELRFALASMRVTKAELTLQGDRIREQMDLIAEKNQQMAIDKDMLKQANERLKDLAERDGLTGVMNHRSLMEFLGNHMRKNSVIGSPSSVILIDIDNFKQLNDQYGHIAGDEALRTIAQVLRTSCPASAGVGRYGGEEFMMILPGASESAALAVAEELRRRIQLAKTSSRPVTASIGVSTVYSMSKSEQTLIDEADKALYHSKRSGKNCVTHYGHGILESA